MKETTFITFFPKCKLLVLLPWCIGTLLFSGLLSAHAETTTSASQAPKAKGALEAAPQGVGQVSVSGRPLTSSSQSLPVSPPIRGVVLDSSGKPRANVQVLPLPYGGKPVVTDAAGHFEMPGPDQRREIFRLIARDEEHNLAASLDLPEKITGTVTITLQPGVTLKGRVLDHDGHPIKGAAVQPEISSITAGPTKVAGFGLSAFQPSDGEGRFEIKALPIQQEYNVGVSAKGYGPKRAEAGLMTEAGERKLKDIVLLTADWSVSGIVRDDRDQPMAGVRVQASGQIQPIVNAKTDTSGRFTVKGLCMGPVSLVAMAPQKIWSWANDECLAGDRDVELFLEKKRPSPKMPQKDPAPLLGKKVPDLKDLNIPENPADFQGRRILVCFFKINDPNSRNALRSLDALAGEFARKKIAVVCVEIWERNEAQLRRWFTRNGIKFPVGMLHDAWNEAPEQRVIYRWALGGQVPWLILTDTDHIVRAEGFQMPDINKAFLAAGIK